MCSVCGGRRAAGASPIRCVGERITATGVPEFREVAWRAYTGNNGFADNTWGAGVYEVGYINSAPAPVTSGLFDWDENEARDEMVDVTNIEGWPSKNEVALFGVFLADENKNILRTERNGYKIRFLRDYHHDRMLNGAYYTDAPKHRLIKSPFICDDNGLLEDLKLNNSFYTGFRSGENRQAYVQEATGENYPFKLFSVNCKNTDKDSQWLSTLDYDPLFLLIKQDLLGNDEYRINTLFNRLENQYSPLLPKGPVSQVLLGYYARWYSSTQNAIGVKDGVLFGYGPAVGWEITNLGPAEEWLNKEGL